MQNRLTDLPTFENGSHIINSILSLVISYKNQVNKFRSSGCKLVSLRIALIGKSVHLLCMYTVLEATGTSADSIYALQWNSALSSLNE